jgi:hypothetical protein
MAIDVIPPAPLTRRPRRQPALGDQAVVDAEFVDLDSKASDPPRFNEVAGTPRAAAAGAATSPGWRPGDRAFWVALAILSAAAFWISGGHALAKLNAGANLHLSEIDSHIVATRIGDVLFVTGRVDNEGDRAVRLPEIAVTVGNAFARADFVSATDRLAAGGSVRFEARLPRADLIDVPPLVELMPK